MSGIEYARASRLVVVPAEAPAEFRIGADADAVVHSVPAWKRERLGDAEWLLAGASPARGAHWLTYLRFDLTVVPPGTRPASAVLGLPLDGTHDAPVGYAVHVVHGEWDEARIRWTDQPLVATEAIARLGGAGEVDQAEVTHAVDAALTAGRASISFVIVPDDPWRAARRRWVSREASGAAEAQRMPNLRIVSGDPPPPLSAARTDLVRGGRTLHQD